MRKSFDEHADGVRIQHNLPAGHHPASILAHALCGADGTPLLDAEKLRAGDSAEQSRAQELLGVSSGGGTFAYASVAPAASTGTTSLTIAAGVLHAVFEVALPDGSYLRKLVLPIADRTAGDVARITIAFLVSGGSSAAQVEVRNADASGSVLYSWGDAAIWGVRAITLDFVYTGTAWVAASQDEDSFGTITCFISPHGNDTSGQKGDPKRPFKTLQAAYDNNAGVLPVVRVEPGCESADLALTCTSLGLMISCDDTPSLGAIVINSNGAGNQYIIGVGSRHSTQVLSLTLNQSSTSAAGDLTLRNLLIPNLTLNGTAGTAGESGSANGGVGCATPSLSLYDTQVVTLAIAAGNGGAGFETGDGGNGGAVGDILLERSTITAQTIASGNGGASSGGTPGSAGGYGTNSVQFSSIPANLQGTNTYRLSLVNGVPAFGTHEDIGAETVSGYITFVDAGGTTRKLAVVS